MNWLFRLNLGLCLGISGPAFAAFVDLDEASRKFIRYTNGYDLAVANLTPGDVIRIGGVEFTLGEFLGEGGASRIFALNQSKVIRLGRSKHDRAFMEAYVTEWILLRRLGRHVVEVDLSSSLGGVNNYAIVERVNVEFTLNEYLGRRGKSNPQRERANRADHALVESELIKFVEATAQFEEIGDYKPAQVAWTGERWVLLDWLGQSELSTPDTKSNDVLDFFENYPESVSPSFRRRLERAFRKGRDECRTLLFDAGRSN